MNCCNEYGTCTKGKECPVHTEENSAAPETGNVWFVGPEPLSIVEIIIVGCSYGLLSVISVGLIAAAIYQFFN